METIIRRLTHRGKLCILNMSPRAKVNSNPIPRGFAPWDWIGLWTFALGKDFSIYDLFFQWIPSNLCPRGFAAHAKNHQKIQLSTFVYQNWPVTMSSAALDPPEYL